MSEGLHCSCAQGRRPPCVCSEGRGDGVDLVLYVVCLLVALVALLSAFGLVVFTVARPLMMG